MMGPVQLHNSAQELHELFAQAQQEGPGRAPNVQEAQDLIFYLHLWNRYKLPRSDLISLMIKAWRPPTWAAECARTKKAALREIGRSQRVENVEASTTTGESNPQDIIHTQAPAAPAIAGPNPVVPATSHHAPLEEQITSNPTKRSSRQTREQAPSPQEICTMHQEAQPEVGPSFITQAADPPRAPAGSSKPVGKMGKTKPQGKDNFPVGTPSPHNSIDQWIQFIYRWQLCNKGA